MKPAANRSRRLRLECLESRLCMASSVGWDGPGLGSAALTYYVGSLPSALNRAEVRSALQTALGTWSAVVDIAFTETNRPNLRDSIDFTFAAIDGAGGTLAQAYFPDDVNPARIAGDIQFDSAERWEIGNKLGSAAYDLVRVAVHEIGHALGLDHSSAYGSVMAPTVSANQSYTSLTSADVNAIQSLYARSAASSGTPTSTTNPTSDTPTTTDSSTLPFTPYVPLPRFDPFSWWSARFWRWQTRFGRSVASPDGDAAVLPSDLGIPSPARQNGTASAGAGESGHNTSHRDLITKGRQAADAPRDHGDSFQNPSHRSTAASRVGWHPSASRLELLDAVYATGELLGYDVGLAFSTGLAPAAGGSFRPAASPFTVVASISSATSKT